MPTARELPASFKDKQWKPGQSGNPSGAPAWKLKLNAIWGDGGIYFEKLAELAQGNVVYGIDRTTGETVRIKPNAYVVLAAFNALRDTAIGKPVQQVISAHLKTDGGLEVPLDDLSDDERAVLAKLSRKLLIKQRQEETANREAIDVALVEEQA